MTQKQTKTKELEDYELIFQDDICVSFSYPKMANPADEEMAPRLLIAQIYNKKGDDDLIQELRIELSDKMDPDFIFVSKIQPNDLDEIKEQYNLDTDFHSFIETMKKFFVDSIKQSMEVRICFYKYSSQKNILSFYKTFVVKFVEIFQLKFEQPSEEYHRQFMQCQFNSLLIEYEKLNSILEKKYHKLHILNPRIEEKVHEEIKNKL